MIFVYSQFIQVSTDLLILPRLTLGLSIFRSIPTPNFLQNRQKFEGSFVVLFHEIYLHIYDLTAFNTVSYNFLIFVAKYINIE